MQDIWNQDLFDKITSVVTMINICLRPLWVHWFVKTCDIWLASYLFVSNEIRLQMTKVKWKIAISVRLNEIWEKGKILMKQSIHWDKYTPCLYWSCSLFVMNDETPLTPPSALAELYFQMQTTYIVWSQRDLKNNNCTMIRDDTLQPWSTQDCWHTNRIANSDWQSAPPKSQCCGII